MINVKNNTANRTGLQSYMYRLHFKLNIKFLLFLTMIDRYSSVHDRNIRDFMRQPFVGVKNIHL